jgi:hypothetical protein
MCWLVKGSRTEIIFLYRLLFMFGPFRVGAVKILLTLGADIPLTQFGDFALVISLW